MAGLLGDGPSACLVLEACCQISSKRHAPRGHLLSTNLVPGIHRGVSPEGSPCFQGADSQMWGKATNRDVRDKIPRSEKGREEMRDALGGAVS